MAKASQQMIAQKLGLAQITVSKALRGDRDISEATKARVRDMADRLGYVANAYARCLADGTSKNIGVIIPRCRGKHYSNLLESMEQALSEAGYIPLLGITSGDGRDTALVKTFLEHRVAGLVIHTPHANWVPPELARIKSSGTPLVILGRTLLPAVCSVCADDYAGVRDAVKYLITYGHRRILFLAWPSKGNPVAALRIKGFQDAISAEGLTKGGCIVESDYESDISAVKSSFSKGASFSAVLCLGDERAFTVIDTLLEMGLTVPDDVSVMGYGDDIEHQDRMKIPLTTMSHNPEEMGRRAIELLTRQIKGEKIECMLELANHLVERHSVSKVDV